MIYVSPSVLAADFANLQKETESIYNADFVHIDVMDGHFVPNITIGVPVVSSLKKKSKIPLDVHLMIEKPQNFLEDFAKAGAYILTIHYESDCNISECLQKIASLGVNPALSIKPGTPVEVVYPYLDKLFMVLIMTVEPGFGGQKLMPECLEKAYKLNKEIQKRNLKVHIQADGGITLENKKSVTESGVDIIVAGSAIFNTDDRAMTIKKFKDI